MCLKSHLITVRFVLLILLRIMRAYTPGRHGDWVMWTSPDHSRVPMLPKGFVSVDPSALAGLLRETVMVRKTGNAEAG